MAARGRALAIVAFLLTVTSLFLAWWRVTLHSGGFAARDDVRLFAPEEPLTTAWGPWATGILVLMAVALLFFRIAARSDRHEPASWRRDLGVASALLAAALLSGLFWPAGVPSFWGGFSVRNETITDGPATATGTAMPGLGWWLALLALALLAVARVRAKAAPPTTEK